MIRLSDRTKDSTPPFHQSLYESKLAGLRPGPGGLDKRIYAAERRVAAEQRRIGQPHNDSYYAKVVDAHVEILRWYVEQASRICREVWKIQGGTLTREFLWMVELPRMLGLVSVRTGSVRGKLMQRRHRASGALGHLVREKAKLESELRREYETEATEIEQTRNSEERVKLAGAIAQAEERRVHQMLQQNQPFSHSADYRSVTIRGKTYNLTSQQAAMIQILHEAHQNRNPNISIALILEQLEKSGGRWQDTFKSNPRAKGALVKSGERKGTLRLNL